MAISVVGAGTLATGTGDVSPGLPAGWAVGDIHHLYVSTANESVSAPAGWSTPANSPQSTGTAGGADGIRISVFWRRAESGDTAPTVTDAGNHTAARILGFRGCVATGDPHDVTSGDIEAVATEVCTFSGVTTTKSNTVLVHACTRAVQVTGAYSFTPSNGSLASFSERIKDGWSDGNGGNLSVWTATKATIGATGDSTGTWFKPAQDISDVQALMLLALAPLIDLVCTPGAYAISGTSVALTASPNLNCTAGSYAVSGTSLGLTITRTLNCTAGSYAISGTSLGMTASRVLNCTAGAYVISGPSIMLTTDNALTCNSGSYAVSGTSVGLIASRLLVSDGAWYQTKSPGIRFGPDVPMVAGNRKPFCDCCASHICCIDRCPPGEICANPWPATVNVDITDESGQCVNLTETLNWVGTQQTPAWRKTVFVQCTHACGQTVDLRLSILVICDTEQSSGWGIAVLQTLPDSCLTSSIPTLTRASCDPLLLETDFCQECEAPLFEPGCPPTLAYCLNYVIYE